MNILDQFLTALSSPKMLSWEDFKNAVIVGSTGLFVGASVVVPVAVATGIAVAKEAAPHIKKALKKAGKKRR